jgi:fatty acid desaturase
MEETWAAQRYEREILELPGRQALAIGVVRQLSRRSDARGALRIIGHFAAMGATGFGVWLALGNWWLLVPAMAVHGATIVTMFAPMHECVHKTAFKSPWLNDAVGWVAGALAFYNFTYYRRFHSWHHRYTQEPKRDPELAERRPRSLAGYLVHVSGLPFWLDRPRDLAALALARMGGMDYIPPHARRTIAWSVRAQLGLYLAVAAVSLAAGSAAAVWFWFLPALLAQPLLRAMLIVEHTGCTHDANGLTNTRTTLASLPVRFLMWNMPFHAEHHLYPSIPFFRLPEAHQRLRSAFAHVAPGYPAANAEVIRRLDRVVTKYDVVGP